MRNPDEVEDVFQDILASIWAKPGKIEQHPNPHAYILRICVTRSYDALRKRARRRRYELFLETIKAKFLPNHFHDFSEDYDRRVAVRQAIAMLPPNQGQAVLLRLVEGCPYRTIAEALGCSEATARSHFSKGKARLVKLLGELGISSYKEETCSEY